MSFSTIDKTNMLRGEGEWKNMQEIVRRTLKMCFDQMDKQGEQVAHLTGQVASLKSQLSNKVNRDEVNDIVKSAQVEASSAAVRSSKHSVSHSDHDKLKDQVAHMRNDLERKASVRYVDECLRLKVDRSDLLVKNLSTFSAAQYSSQLTQMFQELTDTKNAVDALAKATGDIQRDVQGAQDLPVMRSQMEAIYRSMQDFYPKNHVKALLDQKQDVSGLDAILHHKAENAALQTATQRIEQALERHEKAITGLRLKLNDSSLFDARETLARNSALPLFTSDGLPCCSARKCRRKRSSKSKARARSGSGGEAGYYSSGGSGYDSARSTGSCRCNNAEVGGGARTSTAHNTSLNARSSSNSTGGQRVRGPDRAQDMESVLHDGRVQALVEGLWTKVDNSEVTSMRLRQEMEGMRGALSRCETTLSQVAGAAQVETLGLVVEEQRQRIDAILTGSTAIESITEEFIRQQSDISELQAFLQLPQHKPLRAQLDEAGELMDVLSHRVAELGTVVGRAGLRIEAVEMNNKQLETRVQMSENGREKLLHMHQTTDLAGTDFANVKDLARRLSALSGAILGESVTTTSIASLTSKNAPLVNRVTALEVERKDAEESRRQLDARLHELKMIVRTVGFGGGGGGGNSSASVASAPRSSASAGGSASCGASDRHHQQGYHYGGDFERKSNSQSPPSQPSVHSPGPATSPSRRGRVGWSETAAANHNSYRQRDTARSASPLRSPSLSPRSPAKSKSALQVSIGGNAGLSAHPSRSPLSTSTYGYDGGVRGGGGREREREREDLDASRVSVNFEQILTSATSHPSTEFVPVHDVPLPAPSRQAVRYGAYNAQSSSDGLYGMTGAVSNSTSRGAKLENVDQRLQQLKLEKEKLQRRLMDHAVR